MQKKWFCDDNFSMGHLHMAELFVELLNKLRGVSLVTDTVDECMCKWTINVMETLMFAEVKFKFWQDFTIPL